MTKREIFIKAHEYAKTNVETCGSYQIALSIGLHIAHTENKLLDLGCKVWAKSDKRRIYINYYNFEDKDFYGFRAQNASKSSHHFRHCTYEGREISNGKANGIALHLDGSYFDALSGLWVIESAYYNSPKAYIERRLGY